VQELEVKVEGERRCSSNRPEMMMKLAVLTDLSIDETFSACRMRVFAGAFANRFSFSQSRRLIDAEI
jgi:hypothetical protein